ncbi:50S ribosomal protein L19 [Patescibacteria group bacterium]|nr:50S ribosomal protein L19 [Patescibacteria group bacterium]
MADQITLPAVIQPSQIRTGMSIRIHQKIKETAPNGEEKERVQVFEGLVIKMSGVASRKTMIVRKVSGGIGVERIFPLALPSLLKVEVTKVARVRRKDISFVRDSKKRFRDVKNIKLAAV